MIEDSDYDMWALIAQTRHILFKARKKELEEYKISPMKSAVLVKIQELADKATPTQIARVIVREPHSVSEILNRMEKDGLVERIKDPERKGRVRYTLTESGRKAYSQSVKRETIHAIISSLSAEDYRQLSTILKKLRDAGLHELTKRQYKFSDIP